VDRSRARDIADKIIANIQKVIIGKGREVELAVIALLSQGHVLIEDVPGVGKTMLGKSLARSIDCVFKRIQLTPDMLPSDITGVSVFNQQTREFEFRPGPILGQIVLADEINRATPKTQSALLEAMEERQVTVDGITHRIMPSLCDNGNREPDRARRHFRLAGGAVGPVYDAHTPGLSII